MKREIKSVCVGEEQMMGETCSSEPKVTWFVIKVSIRTSQWTLRLGVIKTSKLIFDVVLTVHLIIFISVINQLDAQNFVLQ